MSQADFGRDFSEMSDVELRQYFLANRQNEAAFRAYMDRFSQRPKTLIAHFDDPDFDAKLVAAIRTIQASG